MIKVLIPVVFSEYSLNALTFGMSLAEKIKVEITILHCFPVLEARDEASKKAREFVEGVPSILNMSEDETREKLRNLAEDKINSLSESQKNNIFIKYRFEYGYSEDVIPKVCAQQGCDVVIMGTKTKDETLKELLGNVTNDVIHKVSVPVLAIPAHSTIDLSQIGKVLFITEFKDQDYFSMDRLIRIISAFHTEIHAIHFCQKREDEMDVTRMEQFKLYCESTYRNHPILFRNFTGKEFVSTFEKYVANNGIDLMAMTYIKRNLLHRLFGAEKTRKMLFHTDIPLLVFHS